MRRETRPWTCPKCKKAMKEGGKGPHSVVCGKDQGPRFWAKVKKGPSCWLFQGALNRQGYGALTIVGKWIAAPRAASPGGIESIKPEKQTQRDCFRIKYSDGVEDLTPIENEDINGVKGREGVFYEIIDV